MKPHNGYAIGAYYKKRNPRLWSLGWHTGDDFLTPIGTKAFAMADGRVISTSYNGSYGNNVIVESVLSTGKRVRWSVNHLSVIKVKTGQRIKAGQVVGLTGQSGHVTGPHDHVEARVAPYTFAAANFIDPQALYDWKPKTLVPSWARLRPRTRPKQWFEFVSINLGGMNDHGRATFDARAPKIVADIARVNPHAVAVQELADPEVAGFTNRMRAIGFKRVSGSDGRYLFVRLATIVKAAGVFDLKPRYKNDTKQAAWAVAYINGAWAVLVSGHLESDAAADDERVGQAEHMIEQAERVAVQHDQGKDHIVYAVDTNSDEWVRRQAFNDQGYVDSAETAWKSYGLTLATFTGWIRRTKPGARIDGIYVHRTRPVLFYVTRAQSVALSDHLMIWASIARIPQGEAVAA